MTDWTAPCQKCASPEEAIAAAKALRDELFTHHRRGAA